jgi:LPS export ABC transporter protein LptC
MIKSRLIVIIACLLVLGTIITLIYSGNSLKIKPSYRMSSMHRIQMINKEGNTVKWELSAEKADFPKGNKEILLDSLGLSIKNNPEIYLTSGSGTYLVKEGDIKLNASVEMNIRDTIFKTTEMMWDNSREILTTDNQVKFIGKTFNIVGRGLVAKTKEEKVRILNDVKAVFYL